MEKFTNIYNYDGIIRYVEELAEKKLPVHLWNCEIGGKYVNGDAYVLGHTSIVRNGEDREVVMLSLTGKLEDCFGIPFLPFIHNAGFPVEVKDHYEACFNWETN